MEAMKRETDATLKKETVHMISADALRALADALEDLADAERTPLCPALFYACERYIAETQCECEQIRVDDQYCEDCADAHCECGELREYCEACAEGRTLRRWCFWAEAPRRVAWEGVVCDVHAPLDDGQHLKLRALARYLATFPAEFPRNVRTVGWEVRQPGDPDTCHVCDHERKIEIIARIGADVDEPVRPAAVPNAAQLHQPPFRPVGSPPWSEP